MTLEFDPLSDQTTPPAADLSPAMSDDFTLTFPIPQHIGNALMFTLLFVALCAAVYFAMPSLEKRHKGPGFDTPQFIRTMAVVLSPIWVLIGGYILWNMISLAATPVPTDGTDLRWHILAFLGLVTAFGATISAPLALIRVIATERQTRTAEQGHITDRISAAVEQLGTEKTIKENGDEKTVPNIEVRIGGLLSLERIAQDSTRYDQGRDHVRVMEIICAYVRENAPANGAVDFPLPEWDPLPEDATEEERETHERWRKARFGDKRSSSNAREWAQSLKPPREDIQTALNILKRRSAEQRKVEAHWPNAGPAPEGWVFDEADFKRLTNEPSEILFANGEIRLFEQELTLWANRIRRYKGYRLDLRNTNLQGADLSKAVFSGARLNGVRMEAANLYQARLEGATLRAAHMEGANFLQAKMGGADLHMARMEGASLKAVRLEGANLIAARMEGADLMGARIEWADFGLARMEGVNFLAARTEGTDFSGPLDDETTRRNLGLSMPSADAK